MMFSVIVPVYNVEKYLQQCADSVLNQTYTDFELILVDDGSTDQSGKVCDQYALLDKRVKAIHKENGGLSSARNVGISSSAGEYLVFVDSDDWIETDSLKEFAKIICQSAPEVIETILMEEYENEQVFADRHFSDYLKEKFTRDRALNWIANESENMWPAQKRICKREFIIKNNLFFAEGRLQEDLDWTTRLCYYARSFCGYSRCWYHYRRKREGSITNSVNGKYITDAIEMAASDRKYQDRNDRYSVRVFDQLIAAVYSSINMYKLCSEEDKIKVCACLEENRWLFEYTPAIKYKIFAIGVRALGIRKAMEILSLVG